MNRAYRREIARDGKRKNNRSAKVHKVPKTFDKFQQFDEIDRLLQKLANGEIEYQYNEEWDCERPVLMSKQGNFLDVLSALEGWLMLWREVAMLHKFHDYDDRPFVLLAFKLRSNVELSDMDVLGAIKVADKQKTMFDNIDRSELSRIAIMMQERLRLEAESELAHG
jgi:hypothetical protein